MEGRVCGRPLQERPRHRAKCGAVGGDGMTTNIKRSFGLLLRRARTPFRSLAGRAPIRGTLLCLRSRKKNVLAKHTQNHRRCITVPSLSTLTTTRCWAWRPQRQRQPTAEGRLSATQETRTLAASAQHSKGCWRERGNDWNCVWWASFLCLIIQTNDKKRTALLRALGIGYFSN